MSQGLAIDNAISVSATWTGADLLILALVNKRSCAIQLIYTAYDGDTIFVSVSIDNGATWEPCFMYGPDGQVSSNVAGNVSTIILPGGATHVRAQVAFIFSGSVDVTLTASDVESDQLAALIGYNRGLGGTGNLIPVVDDNLIAAVQERATAGVPIGVVVSTTAVSVLASNAAALSRIITNNGTSNIFLGRDGTVTTSGATMGIKLVPGGSYTDSGTDRYTGPIFAIGTAVTVVANVSAWERTL